MCSLRLCVSASKVGMRDVVDKTGIGGYFDQGLTIFAAMEQQLGLKLEAKGGPIEIVVVDRVERPSGN